MQKTMKAGPRPALNPVPLWAVMPPRVELGYITLRPGQWTPELDVAYYGLGCLNCGLRTAASSPDARESIAALDLSPNTSGETRKPTPPNNARWYAVERVPI